MQSVKENLKTTPQKHPKFTSKTTPKSVPERGKKQSLKKLCNKTSKIRKIDENGLQMGPQKSEQLLPVSPLLAIGTPLDPHMAPRCPKRPPKNPPKGQNRFQDLFQSLYFHAFSLHFRVNSCMRSHSFSQQCSTAAMSSTPVSSVPKPLFSRIFAPICITFPSIFRRPATHTHTHTRNARTHNTHNTHTTHRYNRTGLKPGLRT